MKKTILATVLLTLFGGVASALAKDGDVGDAELALLNSIFTGPIGFSLGLIVLVMGIISFFYNGDKHGIFVIVLGVLITLTPGVYNAASQLFIPMVCSLWSLDCPS